MPGIISDQLINNLRNVAYRQLVDPVTIERRAHTEGPYGSQEGWTVVETTNAWVKSTNTPRIVTGAGQLATSTEQFELRLSVDVDIEIGDRVLINGDYYTVQDTNREETIKLYLKASIRRVQGG